MIKKKNSFQLSTKLFLAIMGASLSMGVVLTSVQISFDYYNTSKRLGELGSETVQMIRFPAFEAARNNDAGMARKVMEGLFAKPYVSEAIITNSSGQTLGRAIRNRTPTAYSWLSDHFFGDARFYSLPLAADTVVGSQGPGIAPSSGLASSSGRAPSSEIVSSPETLPPTMGTLSLKLDAAHNGSQFMSRALTTLYAGLFQSIGFGLILYGIIHGLITRPLAELIRSISEIDPRRPGKSVLRTPMGHDDDEIGTWVESCNVMLEAVAEYGRQRRLAEANVERLTNYDSLTELPNRSLFLKRLEVLTLRADNNGTALFYIGLDDFSSVNLLHSYRVGDRVLITLAERLRKCHPDEALLARVGGDQFCMAISKINETQARELGESLLQLVQQTVVSAGQSLSVFATIGVAFYPRDALTPELLLKNAEQVMLLGKSSGGNRVHFYSEIADHRQRASKQLEKDLLIAVENDQLCLVFQPQVNLFTGQIAGVEALLRWDHPNRGMISPDDFILLAESNRAVIPIGLWVLDNACKSLAQWHDAGFNDLALSINISAVQLHHPGMIHDLERILHHYGLPAGSITLEITESSVMEDLEAAIATMYEIHALGVRLAIDDFGTGYSSLSYLRRMPIDEVKLDRSFFTDLDGHINGIKIVEAMIQLGHSLNLQVVAEGTETPAHVELLQKCRCDRAQGFYYSEPRKADDFLALLSGKIALRTSSVAPSPVISASLA